MVDLESLAIARASSVLTLYCMPEAPGVGVELRVGFLWVQGLAWQNLLSGMTCVQSRLFLSMP